MLYRGASASQLNAARVEAVIDPNAPWGYALPAHDTPTHSASHSRSNSIASRETPRSLNSNPNSSAPTPRAHARAASVSVPRSAPPPMPAMKPSETSQQNESAGCPSSSSSSSASAASTTPQQLLWASLKLDPLLIQHATGLHKVLRDIQLLKEQFQGFANNLLRMSNCGAKLGNQLMSLYREDSCPESIKMIASSHQSMAANSIHWFSSKFKNEILNLFADWIEDAEEVLSQLGLVQKTRHELDGLQDEVEKLFNKKLEAPIWDSHSESSLQRRLENSKEKLASACMIYDGQRRGVEKAMKVLLEQRTQLFSQVSSCFMEYQYRFFRDYSAHAAAFVTAYPYQPLPPPQVQFTFEPFGGFSIDSKAPPVDFSASALLLTLPYFQWSDPKDGEAEGPSVRAIRRSMTQKAQATGRSAVEQQTGSEESKEDSSARWESEATQWKEQQKQEEAEAKVLDVTEIAVAQEAVADAQRLIQQSASKLSNQLLSAGHNPSGALVIAAAGGIPAATPIIETKEEHEEDEDVEEMRSSEFMGKDTADANETDAKSAKKKQKTQKKQSKKSKAKAKKKAKQQSKRQKADEEEVTDSDELASSDSSSSSSSSDSDASSSEDETPEAEVEDEVSEEEKLARASSESADVFVSPVPLSASPVAVDTPVVNSPCLTAEAMNKAIEEQATAAAAINLPAKFLPAKLPSLPLHPALFESVSLPRIKGSIWSKILVEHLEFDNDTDEIREKFAIIASQIPVLEGAFATSVPWQTYHANSKREKQWKEQQQLLAHEYASSKVANMNESKMTPPMMNRRTSQQERNARLENLLKIDGSLHAFSSANVQQQNSLSFPAPPFPCFTAKEWFVAYQILSHVLFPYTPEQIIKALYTMDDKILTPERVGGLLRIFPNEEQRVAILSTTRKYSLTPLEQLFTLLSIPLSPTFNLRLATLNFQVEFGPLAAHLEDKLDSIEKVILEIKKSVRLRILFSIILHLANFLNLSHQIIPSYGFELDFLAQVRKIRMTTEANANSSLLDFLVYYLSTNYPHLSFASFSASSFPHLYQVLQIDEWMLAMEMRYMDEQYQRVRQLNEQDEYEKQQRSVTSNPAFAASTTFRETASTIPIPTLPFPAQSFPPRVTRFLSYIHSRSLVIRHKYLKVRADIVDMCKYLCVQPVEVLDPVGDTAKIPTLARQTQLFQGVEIQTELGFSNLPPLGEIAAPDANKAAAATGASSSSPPSSSSPTSIPTHLHSRYDWQGALKSLNTFLQEFALAQQDYSVSIGVQKPQPVEDIQHQSQ